jgi:flagellar motor switch protein FliM
MRSANEAFARALEEALSGCLQTETKVELRQIGLTTANNFRKELPTPACLIMCRLHPRTDRVILHLACATALTMLEMLLGGTEPTEPAPREITEIEWSLLEEVIRVMVRALGEAWRVFHAVEFEVESLGSDPALLSLPETGLPLARLMFGVQWGEKGGSFELALPQAFFDLRPDSPQSQELTNIPAQVDLDRNFELLEEAGVKLEVTLHGPTMAFEELLGLETGQVITFDYPINRPVRATLNGAAAMTGHIVSAMQKRAFQIERLPAKSMP